MVHFLRNSPLFYENRRQHGLAVRDLAEKLVKTAMGVSSGPPSKNTILPGTQTMYTPNPGKKVRFFPWRMVQWGGNPHFVSKIGDSMVWLPGILLKKWSKQGVPPF